MYTFPCAVDSSLFEFNFENRTKIRESLGFTKNQLVGVYAGKFGGMYLDIPELIFIGTILKSFPDLGIIILTEDTRNSIIRELKKVSNPGLKIIVKNVSHSDVPKYLSAADFGLSLNKFFPSGKYLSPIKIGEYLANGLPVLMTEGIGDENNYLEKEKAGVLFNMENLEYKLNSLQKILNEPDHRERISKLASKYRSFHQLKEIYKNLIFQD